MEIKIFKSGLLQTNAYLIIKEDNCIVVDPAFAYDKIIFRKNNFLSPINKLFDFLPY